MKINKGFEKLSGLLGKKQTSADSVARKKPPAYEWQEFALRVIQELSVPNFKRGAVFKACKENPKNFIEQCLNDTKELCKTGERWKYFFKLVSKDTQIYK